MSGAGFATKEVLQDTVGLGELARQAGVAPSAVRFYEQHGLVTAYRTTGNQRRFRPEAACRIMIARVAQQVGLTVREIVEILEDLPADAGQDDWEGIGQRLIDEARARIRRLERVIDAMAASERYCEADPRIDP